MSHISAMNEATTNAPEFTVAELSSALKRTLEDRFAHIRVRGEISNYRGPHSSGHVYFCLKDQNARLDAVIWKTTFARLRFRPQEGLEVVATGKITSFPGKSAYQIVIESLEPAGVGALMALLEERRRVLAAEGLFDEARKKPLPFLPEVVGVVTSPTGAVIRDILHRLADRFPRRVILWPARVQGETSAAEVAAAIRGFNALPADGAIPRPSILIVARGGGSLEDLWGFNDEAVVRAASDSRIPLVSAIGHETDWTLLDLVADRRAPTPTGAAEMSVPMRADLLERVGGAGQRKLSAARRSVAAKRAAFRAHARVLPSLEGLLAFPRQKLDRASERLVVRSGRALQERRIRVASAGAALARHSPRAELARRRERAKAAAARLARARDAFRLRGAAEMRRRLAEIQQRSRRAMANRLERWAGRLGHAFQLMRSLSHASVLARGYALVRGPGDRPMKTAAEIAPRMRLTLQFSDGAVSVAAEGPEPARAKARSLARAEKKQGVLF